VRTSERVAALIDRAAAEDAIANLPPRPAAPDDDATARHALTAT
jgi:hypothetical protein